MPIKGRLDLENLSGSNLPTNNSKQITASKHRAVVSALIESLFNLTDDTLENIAYDAQQTLSQKLAGLFREVIQRGSFTGLDVGGHSVGNNFTTDGTIVDTATVNGTANNDTIVRVVFKPAAGDITQKAVIPIFHFTGSNGDASNDVGYPVIKIISSNSLDVAMGEFRGQVQSLKVEFILL